MQTSARVLQTVTTCNRSRNDGIYFSTDAVVRCPDSTARMLQGHPFLQRYDAQHTQHRQPALCRSCGCSMSYLSVFFMSTMAHNQSSPVFGTVASSLNAQRWRDDCICFLLGVGVTLCVQWIQLQHYSRQQCKLPWTSAAECFRPEPEQCCLKRSPPLHDSLLVEPVQSPLPVSAALANVQVQSKQHEEQRHAVDECSQGSRRIAASQSFRVQENILAYIEPDSDDDDDDEGTDSKSLVHKLKAPSGE